ncbi:MAG: sugar transferase [Planctomycetes bacterium]|nr:sugar transferase [Planctomycetota bacterium]
MFVDSENLLRESRPATPPEVALPATPGWYATTKIVVDSALALVLLILTAPLLLFAIILVKLTSPGPAIYTQTRVGRGGKPFTIYKLRTMANNCESLTGAQWSKPGDSRITRVGRWLRKTHLDELPQLWNVLKGDMSLIGPRPERPEFVPQLEQAIPLYRERLQVRPGVTGFAQIQLPPDTDLESVRIKLAYDLHYVLNVGLWFDVMIYLGTMGKLLGLSFAGIRALCRFPESGQVDDAYRRLTTTSIEPKT